MTLRMSEIVVLVLSYNQRRLCLSVLAILLQEQIIYLVLVLLDLVGFVLIERDLDIRALFLDDFVFLGFIHLLPEVG